MKFRLIRLNFTIFLGFIFKDKVEVEVESAESSTDIPDKHCKNVLMSFRILVKNKT